jgi:hypothetical protein
MFVSGSRLGEHEDALVQDHSDAEMLEATYSTKNGDWLRRCSNKLEKLVSCPEAIDPCPPVLLDVVPDHVGRTDCRNRGSES